MIRIKKWRQISRILLYVALIVVLIAMFWVAKINDVLAHVLIGIFILLSLSGIVLSFIFWRCPHCNERFPLPHTKFDKMECCPFCGKDIE